MWKDFSTRCKKDGDLWYTDKPILTKKRYFCYKYVILNPDGSLSSWERGVDRIADLEILEERQTYGKNEHDPKQPVKTVLLDDEWEEFTMYFTINHPSNDPGQQIILDGNTTIFDYQNMTHVAKPTSWMPNKYGK